MSQNDPRGSFCINLLRLFWRPGDLILALTNSPTKPAAREEMRHAKETRRYRPDDQQAQPAAHPVPARDPGTRNAGPRHRRSDGWWHEPALDISDPSDCDRWRADGRMGLGSLARPAIPGAGSALCL